ncbi:4900_t:CDS:1 [Paraglomus brasilianum]|uniref:4900_t:CDS:1 n=1 Tax=Paraglomus brasilianum TaxID=144538 RepID=A0A9N9A1P2_9GLOM|nr:4900_t:CDS:1 [Paraglomus brasilianum]
MLPDAYLLAIGRYVYVINPLSGATIPLDLGDWTSATAAAIIPSTRKAYVTTSFNNLWEIDLAAMESHNVSWNGWGTCNALVAVPNSVEGHPLFAFCHKLWLVDDPSTGQCTDFLGGFTDVWTKVNAATSVGMKIFATTSANNLWCIDTVANEVTKLGGGSDNWSNCHALVEVEGKLYAFCYGLWEVDVETGHYTQFFDEGSEERKINWSHTKSATVIDTKVYVFCRGGIWAKDQLLELDINTKKVREISMSIGNLTNVKVLIAVDRNVIAIDHD